MRAHGRSVFYLTLFISASTQRLGEGPDLINTAARNNDPSLFPVFAACVFWVAFPSAWVPPPHVKVITEKAGNASLLGWAVGDVYAWIFPVPKTPCIFFFSFKLRKKRCFHSPDSLTASPCLEGEVVSCPYPKRGHQGCLRVAFSSSSCADGGGQCSFADLTERKVFFLQLRPQQEDRTQRQEKQVPTSLLSAPLCEVGH